jgi:hypothetical protein
MTKTSADTDFDLKLYMVPILNNKSVLNSDFSITTAKFTPQPRFNVGFHYYIHQSYGLFNKKIEELASKTFYWAMNSFEVLLSSQEIKYELIDKVALYLDSDRKELEKVNVIFYQIWEIMVIFNMINKHVNININSPLQDDIRVAVDYYRLKLANKAKITYNTKDSNIAIITVNESNNLLEKESHMYVALMEKITAALHNMNNGGNLIVKLDDTFELPTLKMIQLCKCLFDNVYIYKPYYSRPTSSEKYIICTNFEEKSYSKIAKSLKKAVDEMTNLGDKFVVDFMSDIELDNKLTSTFAYINSKLSGIEHKAKNKILGYIKSDNYFGNEYQEAIKQQQNAVEYFLTHFFPINNNDYVDILKHFINTIKENNDKLIKMHTEIN